MVVTTGVFRSTLLTVYLGRYLGSIGGDAGLRRGAGAVGQGVAQPLSDPNHEPATITNYIYITYLSVPPLLYSLA